MDTETKPATTASSSDSNDKLFGVLAYIGILWLVPMLASKTKFARFHANQGLVLFIFEVVLWFVWLIPVIGWIIGFVGWILVLVLAIMGIINAAGGQMKPLPVIGGIELIK